jgi:hypothetical protein
MKSFARALTLAALSVACSRTPAPPAPRPTPTPARDAAPATAVLTDRSVCRLSDGSVAPLGRLVPAGDGCNHCTCNPGGWSCSELACNTPRPAMARYTNDGRCHLTNDSVATVGTVAPSDDGCNHCRCEVGGWACTEMACANR